MNITFIPNRSITLVTSDFHVLTATKDNPNWTRIEAAVRANDEQALISAISIKESVEGFGSNISNCGKIEIRDSKVFYRGELLYGEDVNRIISYLTNNFPSGSMVAFLEAKTRNESAASVASLYSFLENKGMPITDNGTVLGYKGVNEDYFSINTGNEPLIEGTRNERGGICNKIGCVIAMDRRYVCADNTNACSGGLHIGSKNYATTWSGGGRVMVVEFSPEHVVSVPTTEHEKLRVCRYRVVGELNGDCLGDTYNSDYVRPHNESIPSLVEIDPEFKKDGIRYNISHWSKGQAKGFKDGKGHKKRLYYEEDRGGKFNKFSGEFVAGYLVGYQEGRSWNFTS